MTTLMAHTGPRSAVLAFGMVSVGLGVAVGYQGLWVIAVLVVVAVLGTALKRPLGVVIGVVLYLPVEGFLLKIVPGTVGGVMSAVPELVLIVCAFAAVRSGRAGVDGNSAVLWVAWIGVFVAMGLVSAYAGGVAWLPSVYWLRTMVRYMPAALVVGALVGRREFTTIVAPAFAVGIVLQAGIAVVEFVGGPVVRAFFSPGNVVVGGVQFVGYGAAVTTGVAGTLGFYNNFALYAAMCFAISVAALRAWASFENGAIAGGAFRHMALRSGVVASIVCVLLAGSRQGIIVFLVLIVVMVAIVGLEGVGGKVALIGIMGAGIVMVALLSPDLAGPLAWIPERFGRVFSMADVNQSLLTDRLFVFTRVAPAVLASSPLLGLGPGALYSGLGVATVAGALSLSAEGVAYVQDVGWVGLVAQLGLVGLTLMLWLFAWLLGRARDGVRVGWLLRGESAAVIGCVVVAALGMMTSSVLLIRATSLALWCVAGLCLRDRSVPTSGTISRGMSGP